MTCFAASRALTLIGPAANVADLRTIEPGAPAARFLPGGVEGGSMNRVVRGGLIQVKADISLEGGADEIKRRMIDKHLPLI